MASLNRIVLMGKLEDKAEVRVSTSGEPVANFKLSVDRPVKADGFQSTPDSIKIVAWAENAKKVEPVQAGTIVIVEGWIKTRNYENNEGIRIYVTEVESKTIRLLNSENVEVNNEQFIPADTNLSTQNEQKEYQENSQSPILESTEENEDIKFDMNTEAAPVTSLPEEFGENVEEDIPF